MLTTPSRHSRRPFLPAAIAMALTGGLLASGFTGAPAQAAETTTEVKFQASDDAYVSSARPTYRFGSNVSLIAGAAKTDRMVTYVKVKVGALPAGGTVKKAELRIMLQQNQWPAELKVKAVASTSWSEATLDWRNRPATGGDLATVRPAPTAPEVRFDLTRAVRKAGTYTFAVTSPSTSQFGRFHSTESGWQGPKLFLKVSTPAPKPQPTTPTPTTPAPTTPAPTPTTPTPTTPAPTPTQPEKCTVDAKLVPSCGLLWGAAAGGFSDTPRDEALKIFDAKVGRDSNVYHTYHHGDQLFPTKAEIAMARDPETPRLLMLNWKVAYGTKWANVARGEQNARIDRLSAFIKTTFPEKFFLVLHHEPENDVVATAGSGMQAKDYAAMFRHTVTRMRANGVSNAVFTMSYMNYEKWNNSSWWYDLYPGDDVVDWLALDSYVNVQPGGFHNGDFAYLMDRTTAPDKFPGWYTWATTQHPGKPIIVSEWGAYDSSPVVDPANKARFFDTVLPQLAKFPAVKGLVYFETASDQAGRDIRMDSSPESLAAFQRIAADPRFDVHVR